MNFTASIVVGSLRDEVSLRWSQWAPTLGRIAVMLLLAAILATVVRKVIDRATLRVASNVPDDVELTDKEDSVRRAVARSSTVASVLKSLATWAIWTVAILVVLGEFNINLGPLLAGASVAGVALGFGSQSLVRDMLSGVFILLEDQYGVGDIVDAGPATGTVERVTLRSTRLRDVAGTVWHIPNGSITRVGNKSQNWARAVVDVVVSHEADLRHAQRVLDETANALAADPAWGAIRLAGEPEVEGVSSLRPDGITLRLVVDTEPKMQWKVERELRIRIKEAFDAEDIPLEVHHWSPPKP